MGARTRGPRSLVLFAAAVSLASCASTIRVSPSQLPLMALSAEILSLSSTSNCVYDVRPGSMTGRYGCAVSYEVFSPEQPRTETMVVLAHGFFRNLTNMRGWARLWASRGVPTVIMSFCNSTPFAGNHERNAEDMRAVAERLHSGPVLYAGFSAGALAAIIAASRDPRAAAYLGLDPADRDGLAARAASRLAVPAFVLLGEPSSCNSEGNIVPAIPAQPGIGMARVIHTVHCMFEDPSDGMCNALCGKVEPPEVSAESVTVIRALTTAWVLERTGASDGESAILAGMWAGDAQWEGRVRVLQCSERSCSPSGR
jgi:pimeloyl-ACP methyl ester carboxylesterase